MSIDIEELKQAALKATPGPWEAEVDDGEGTTEVNAGSALTTWTEYDDGLRIGSPARSWRTTDRIVERDDLYDEDFEQAAADAEFIAAWNPAVALGVLERLREAESDRDAAEKQSREDAVQLRMALNVKDAALSRIARVEALHERIGASWPHNGGVYVCRADGGIWPCPTVRALTEGEPDGNEG